MASQDRKKKNLRGAVQYLNWLPENLRHFVKCKVQTYVAGKHTFEVRTYMVLPITSVGKVVAFGPDDLTYKKHPELLQLIPRGFSELYLNNILLRTIRGPDKFDGTTAIDEDDSDQLPESQHGLLDDKKIQQWSESGILQVRWQEKANGKFAIFTIFPLDDIWYIFGGSKNVHIVEKIGLSNKFSPIHGKLLHHDILNKVLEDLNKMSEEELKALDNQTIVGEYVDGMHMVWVDKPYMVYFSVPENSTFPAIQEILPRQNILPTAEQLHTIRMMKNIEGVVICYVNTKTGEILRQKHKSVWYILLRCWREILSRKDDNTNLDTLSRMLQNRNKERSNQFLHLEEKELREYDILADSFVRWLSGSKYSYRNVSFSGGVGIARIFHEYLQNPIIPEEKKASYVVVDPTPEDILECPKLYGLILKLAKVGHKVAVITTGLPGCGKSTIVAKLIRELDELKITTSRHCTDDFFMVGDEYHHDVKKLGEYHAKNFQNFCSSQATVKFNENTNTQRWEYQNYLQHASNEGYICIVLSCNVPPIDVLMSRNTHGVPENTLMKMAKRYKSPPPSYYGVFVTSELIPVTVLPHVVQTQPLHVTCVFVGGNKGKDDRALRTYDKFIGTDVDITVTSMITSDAGIGLSVTVPTIPVEAKYPHITLHTKNGFKPVNVGEMMGSGTAEATSFVLPGVFAPMWM